MERVVDWLAALPPMGLCGLVMTPLLVGGGMSGVVSGSWGAVAVAVAGTGFVLGMAVLGMALLAAFADPA